MAFLHLLQMDKYEHQLIIYNDPDQEMYITYVS